MSSNPFLSKEVKFKRVLKGFAIIFPVFIMILTITAIYYDLIDEALREHYVGVEEDRVLGAEDEEPHLIGFYGDVNEDDTLVWDWDPNWNRENYYILDRYLDNPEFYIPEDKYTLKESWTLKDGYILEMNCQEVVKETAAGMNPHSCTLTYNGQILSDEVRYEVFCSDYNNYDNCSGTVRFVVFSDLSGSKGSKEFIAVSDYATGSKDWLSIYKIQNGKANMIPFPSGEEDIKPGSWYISLSAFEMYGLYSTWENSKDFNDPIEVVTYFHEPSMGSKVEGTENNVEGIFRIWGVENGRLELKENVIDLYREDDLPHWF
jgi:hypothetical protein